MKNIKTGIIVPLLALCIMGGCKKGSKPAPDPTPVVEPDNGGATGPITTPTEPSVAASQGFFLDDWQGKTFTKPSTIAAAKPTASTTINVTADFSQVVSKVSKYLFGNNINPFTGQYTDAATVNNITNLSPNIIRAPGGSLSDVYFWHGAAYNRPPDVPEHLLNADGSVSVVTSYWSGRVDDIWSLSLNNYYSLLQKTNATGIITVNYGYARYGTGVDPVATAAGQAAQWVRFDKGRTKYWEVGNECYGNWEAGYRIDQSKNKDGQPAIITGELYGKHFKVFADSMRKAAADIGATIKIGAVLHESADNGNPTIVANWNRGVLSQIGDKADFYIGHNYYTNYNENSNAITILNTAEASSKATIDYLKGALQAGGLAQKPIALTEWNIFSTGSKQQISNIAGVHSVLVLGELIKNQYGQASRWDLANGWDVAHPGDDHGLFSFGQNGLTDFTPRPAFYYLYYFQKYFGDRMISSSVSGSTDVVSYASSFNSGEAGVVLVNKSTTDQVVNINFKNYYTGSNYYYYALKGGTDNGEFSGKVLVNGNGPTGDFGGPANYKTLSASVTGTSGGIKVSVPARGVVFLVTDKK
jgi:hypothetical protein